MKGAPCKDCADRVVGCHSTCQKYKQFQIDSSNKKEIIKNSKNEHNQYLGFVRDQKERIRRSRGSSRYT